MRVFIKKQESDISDDNVRWYLSDEQLWITVCKKYADIEKSITNSYGSFNWLYEVNDTVLFEKESGRFKTAIIDLSGKIIAMNVDNILKEENYKIIGDMFLVEKKNYDFEFPQKVSYTKANDYLTSIPSDLKISEDVVMLFITHDFAFIINDNLLKGWILKNASNHICMPNSYRKVVSDAPVLLYNYITALNLWEENEENTIALKKILNHIDLREDTVSLAIKECLKNIL